MRPWCIRFFGRETRKSTKINSIVASTNNIIFWGTCFFFLRTSRQKQKTKKIGEKLEKLLPLYLWYADHIKDALDNHEQSGGGAGCERPRQRGTDASFTYMLLRSCRDVRRPRHPSNAKTAAISQPDPDGTCDGQPDALPGHHC